jgi:hypothetical protein
MDVRRWLADRLLAREVDRRVQAALRPAEDRGWRPLAEPAGALRRWPEVRATLERAAETCRTNPLAARLVGMTTDFVVGSGATVATAAGGPPEPFVSDFWAHPLNHLDLRVYRWGDELTRAGELFLALCRNPADGMSYVREIPAAQIDGIDTDPDDLEHELRYHQLTGDIDGTWWPGREGGGDQILLHYAINRPVGEVRGISDLAAVLPWLERYDLWLEDRVRINRYKGAYLWHVKVEGALPGQLEAKRAQYARIPSPGSLIVTDGHETWTAVQPQIGADDVEADGKAIRLMIAAGAGVPLHFLAEGESATRATAREMGTATFRHFSHRQHVFAALVEDVIRVAAERAGRPAPDVRVQFEAVLAEDERGAAAASD